jgi:hypothetical protein
VKTPVNDTEIAAGKVSGTDCGKASLSLTRKGHPILGLEAEISCVMITDAEIERLARACERNNVRVLQLGNLRIEMGPPRLAAAPVRLRSEDVFKGLTEDQILGLEPLPDGHPLTNALKDKYEVQRGTPHRSYEVRGDFATRYEDHAR